MEKAIPVIMVFSMALGLVLGIVIGEPTVAYEQARAACEKIQDKSWVCRTVRSPGEEGKTVISRGCKCEDAL